MVFSNYQAAILVLSFHAAIFELTTFFPEFELLLQFLRSLKHDTILFGLFNIDTIKDSADKIKYENLLLAYNFRRQTVSQHELHQYHQRV